MHREKGISFSAIDFGDAQRKKLDRDSVAADSNTNKNLKKKFFHRTYFTQNNRLYWKIKKTNKLYMDEGTP